MATEPIDWEHLSLILLSKQVQLSTDDKNI